MKWKIMRLKRLACGGFEEGITIYIVCSSETIKEVVTYINRVIKAEGGESFVDYFKVE